jgi:hypothetical protein
VSRGDIYIDAVTGNSLFYNATIKHLGEYSHGAKRLVKLKIKIPPLLLLQMPRHVIVEIKPYKLHQVVGHILSDATRGNGIMTYNMNKGTNYSAAVNFTDADNN